MIDVYYLVDTLSANDADIFQVRRGENHPLFYYGLTACYSSR